MNAAGLPWPEDWDRAWNRIKQVWASKWNDRACLSRKRMGIPHENLSMAVLVQQVVPADYAYVIHTVNPTNGNRDELYAEMVLGLGRNAGRQSSRPRLAPGLQQNDRPPEHPRLSEQEHRALWRRPDISAPIPTGKIWPAMPGAGLYDSVLLEPPTEKILDYSQERLIWDEGFRRDLFAGVLRVGLEIERVSGSPQDIEGAIAQGKNYVVQTRPQVGAETAK